MAHNNNKIRSIMMKTNTLVLSLTIFVSMLISPLQAFILAQFSSPAWRMIQMKLCATATPQMQQIQLSQVSAEVITCKPASAIDHNAKRKSPLIFIHGSFHASWCWAEQFMPYFANQLGHSCYALSLRGTGGTFAGEGVKKAKIMEHVQDLTEFIQYVIEEERNDGDGEIDNDLRQRLPVVISHSFGGLAVMKYLEQNLLEDEKNETSLRGIAMMCSVPPSGNGKMTMRFLQRSLGDSWKITAGLAMKKCITNKELCRELFFDNSISDNDIERYQRCFKRDSVATIDLGDLATQLPSKNTNNANGEAVFVDKIPPSIVIGATDDFIVDVEGVEETARYFGVDPVMVESPHDVMLQSKWNNGARAIEHWLEEIQE